MEYDQIQFIEDYSFYSLDQLTYLYLSNNLLIFNNSDCFRGLSNLQNLYLENNQINSIPNGLFDDLNNN